jgi:hypothetical protein
MVPLHTPILLWVMWIAEEHRDPEGLTKTDQGGRKVTAEGVLRPTEYRGPA